MFPYTFYKVVHLFGVMLTWFALGGLVLHVANGGDKESNKHRALVAATHGVGLLIILVGGFGLLARLGQMHGVGFPVWIWIKLAIWVVTGVLIMVPLKVPKLARPLWLLIPLLGGLAVYVANYKPFLPVAQDPGAAAHSEQELEAPAADPGAQKVPE